MSSFTPYPVGLDAEESHTGPEGGSGEKEGSYFIVESAESTAFCAAEMAKSTIRCCCNTCHIYVRPLRVLYELLEEERSSDRPAALTSDVLQVCQRALRGMRDGGIYV